VAPRPEPLPESPQIPARKILIVFGVGVVLTVLSVVGLGGYYAYKARGLAAPAAGAFPAPRLDVSLQRVPAKTPSANGHQGSPPAIPIDRAMAMVAARGTEAYDPPGGPGP
jgi:uncharacterized membrane protein